MGLAEGEGEGGAGLGWAELIFSRARRDGMLLWFAFGFVLRGWWWFEWRGIGIRSGGEGRRRRLPPGVVATTLHMYLGD